MDKASEKLRMASGFLNYAERGGGGARRGVGKGKLVIGTKTSRRESKRKRKANTRWMAFDLCSSEQVTK